MTTTGMFDPVESDHYEEGEAPDGETIIRLRPKIEDYVREHGRDFDHTELYWNLKDKDNPDGPFVFQLHFFVNPKE